MPFLDGHTTMQGRRAANACADACRPTGLAVTSTARAPSGEPVAGHGGDRAATTGSSRLSSWASPTIGQNRQNQIRAHSRNRWSTSSSVIPEYSRHPWRFATRRRSLPRTW